MTKYRKYTKRKHLRKRRGTKRRGINSRGINRQRINRQGTKRRQYGGQVGIYTNPNEFNDEEKVLERQSRLLA